MSELNESIAPVSGEHVTLYVREASPPPYQLLKAIFDGVGELYKDRSAWKTVQRHRALSSGWRTMRRYDVTRTMGISEAWREAEAMGYRPATLRETICFVVGLADQTIHSKILVLATYLYREIPNPVDNAPHSIYHPVLGHDGTRCWLMYDWSFRFQKEDDLIVGGHRLEAGHHSIILVKR